MELLKDWTAATSRLKPGVQRVFHDTFALAAEGKTHLVYGSDYRDGSPCLVNTVGTMLTTGGGHGIPSAHFGEVVSLFDRINREFESTGVNDRPGYVSELAADILLRNFSELKDMPEPKTVDGGSLKENANGVVYYEPTDEEMAEDMVRLLQGDTPPCGEAHYESNRENFDNLVVVKPEYGSEGSISEPPC